MFLTFFFPEQFENKLQTSWPLTPGVIQSALVRELLVAMRNSVVGSSTGWGDGKTWYHWTGLACVTGNNRILKEQRQVGLLNCQKCGHNYWNGQQAWGSNQGTLIHRGLWQWLMIHSVFGKEIRQHLNRVLFGCITRKHGDLGSWSLMAFTTVQNHKFSPSF